MTDLTICSPDGETLYVVAAGEMAEGMPFRARRYDDAEWCFTTGSQTLHFLATHYAVTRAQRIAMLGMVAAADKSLPGMDPRGPILLSSGRILSPGELPAWCEKIVAYTPTDDRCARLHFGRNEDSAPACQIKAGAEQGLLGALRDAEYAANDAQLAMANECTDAARAYYAATTRHAAALQSVEELGYERGLADGRASTPPAIPAGTKLVPIEPTREMVKAGVLAWERHNHGSPYTCEIHDIYASMLAAAPDPTHD